MDDEALPCVSLIAHEIEVERKVRTIRRIIVAWAVTVVAMAAAIGVVYG